MLNTKLEETFWCRFIPYCHPGDGACGWDYASMQHQKQIFLQQNVDGVMTNNSYTVPPDEIAGIYTLTLHLQPQTPNPKPSTLNPKP